MISDGTAATGPSCVMDSPFLCLAARHWSLLVLHNICSREEMVSERLHTAELQTKLSSSVQEKLTTEGQRERLELEMQRLKEQLKWHQEQLSLTKEMLPGSQTPEQQGCCSAAHLESRLSPVKRIQGECQVIIMIIIYI